MAKYTAAERAEAIEMLRRYLKDGTTVYTILESVASSGMSRSMRVITLEADGPRYLTYNVARALGYACKRGKLGNDVISVRGCGMDMGFALVDELQSALAPLKLEQRWL